MDAATWMVAILFVLVIVGLPLFTLFSAIFLGGKTVKQLLSKDTSVQPQTEARSEWLDTFAWCLLFIGWFLAFADLFYNDAPSQISRGGSYMTLLSAVAMLLFLRSYRSEKTNNRLASLMLSVFSLILPTLLTILVSNFG